MDGVRSERAFPTAVLHCNPGEPPSAAGTATVAMRHFRQPRDAPPADGRYAAWPCPVRRVCMAAAPHFFPRLKRFQFPLQSIAIATSDDCYFRFSRFQFPLQSISIFASVVFHFRFSRFSFSLKRFFFEAQPVFEAGELRTAQRRRACGTAYRTPPSGSSAAARHTERRGTALMPLPVSGLSRPTQPMLLAIGGRARKTYLNTQYIYFT